MDISRSAFQFIAVWDQDLRPDRNGVPHPKISILRGPAYFFGASLGCPFLGRWGCPGALLASIGLGGCCCEVHRLSGGG